MATVCTTTNAPNANFEPRLPTINADPHLAISTPKTAVLGHVVMALRNQLRGYLGKPAEALQCRPGLLAFAVTPSCGYHSSAKTAGLPVMTPIPPLQFVETYQLQYTDKKAGDIVDRIIGFPEADYSQEDFGPFSGNVCGSSVVQRDGKKWTVFYALAKLTNGVPRLPVIAIIVNDCTSVFSYHLQQFLNDYVLKPTATDEEDDEDEDEEDDDDAKIEAEIDETVKNTVAVRQCRQKTVPVYNAKQYFDDAFANAAVVVRGSKKSKITELPSSSDIEYDSDGEFSFRAVSKKPRRPVVKKPVFDFDSAMDRLDATLDRKVEQHMARMITPLATIISTVVTDALKPTINAFTEQLASLKQPAPPSNNDALMAQILENQRSMQKTMQELQATKQEQARETVQLKRPAEEPTEQEKPKKTKKPANRGSRELHLLLR